MATDLLEWSLPNGETQRLRYTGASQNGTERTSTNGNFIATLTSITGQDPNFMFDSTLMIREAMNYSMSLTCIPGSGVSETTMIVVSGKFDFYGPKHPTHRNNSVFS